jgi:transcriptional regulator with PAS, ATPase and Fis domain
MADGGTLFLDEIGDMPPALQAKLLKVLESGEVMPLGETRPKHSDIRLVTATNQDIEAKIKEGTFREDLYYRINVIEITIPPLRQRKEDIPLLAEHFVGKFSEQNRKNIKGLTPEAMDILIKYSWPGNIRELANVMERAVVMCQGELIEAKCLPQKLSMGEEAAHLLKERMNEYERNLIMASYETHNRNKEATANALGIDLATLYRKMKKLSIED